MKMVGKRPKAKRRFDPVAHGRWQRRLAGGKVSRRVDRVLTAAREERG